MVGGVVGGAIARAVAARVDTRYAAPAEPVTAVSARLTCAAASRYGWRSGVVAGYGVLPTARFSETNAGAERSSVCGRAAVVYGVVAAACEAAVSARAPVVV